MHFVCVGTPQRTRRVRRRPDATSTPRSTRSPRTWRAGARRRQVDRAGRHRGPAGRARRRSSRPRAPTSSWPGTPSSCARASPSRTPCTRTGWSSACASDGAEQHAARGLRAGDRRPASPLVVTDFATAELVKVAANSFLATKISFINAMAEVCEATGARRDRAGRGARPRRRGSAAGSCNAGLGFGGGCLPKDIRAFMARAGELGVDQALTFLSEVDAINMRRRARMVDLAREAARRLVRWARRVAVLGAAFKPNTDDVRDSPALDVAAAIQLHGAQVAVYDPKAMDNARRCIPTLQLRRRPRSRRSTGADVVLHLTEWARVPRHGPGGRSASVRAPSDASSTAATRSTPTLARGRLDLPRARPALSRRAPVPRGRGRRPRPRIPRRVPCGMRPPRRALNRASGRSSGAPLPPVSPPGVRVRSCRRADGSWAVIV